MIAVVLAVGRKGVISAIEEGSAAKIKVGYHTFCTYVVCLLYVPKGKELVESPFYAFDTLP